MPKNTHIQDVNCNYIFLCLIFFIISFFLKEHTILEMSGITKLIVVTYFNINYYYQYINLFVNLSFKTSSLMVEILKIS